MSGSGPAGKAWSQFAPAGAFTHSHRAGAWLRRHGEWVFVVAALLCTGSALVGIDPRSDADTYIASTFGVELVVVACYTVWFLRAERRRVSRPVIAFVGVPVAVYLAMLPDAIAGHLNDDSTGTVESLFLLALVLGVCVLIGMLVALLVFLPIGLALRGVLLAARGRVAGMGLIIAAVFPLSIVGGGVAGSLAMDDVPNDPLVPGAGGVAMVARAFGVDNGVRIVDGDALVWFRVLVVIDLMYVIGLCCLVGVAARRLPQTPEKVNKESRHPADEDHQDG